MFARKIQSVIWMSRNAGGDRRRNFESLYVFADGFSSREELEARIRELGLSRDSFLFLDFCGMSYAVSLNSYHSRLVLTKEKIYLKEGPGGGFDVMDASDFDPDRAVITEFPVPDRKNWQDGMCCDMEMADPSLALFRADGSLVGKDEHIWNNAIISFALNFFIREIRISTNEYVEHVFSNYYSDRSLVSKYETVYRLRDQGYLYYNPFWETVSRTESEKRKKEKKLLEGLQVPPVIKREEVLPGIKLMKEREADPARMYSQRPLRYQGWYGGYF